MPSTALATRFKKCLPFFISLGFSVCSTTGTLAQKAQVTSIFSEPLSLQTLGPIKNIDTSAGCLLRQAPDGHLVITGDSTKICCPPGHFIEMVPKMKITGFNAVSMVVYEDGKSTQSFGLEATSGIPMIRIDPPEGRVDRKRVKIVLYDDQRHARAIQECVLSSRSSDASPHVTTSLESEMCAINTGGDMVECRLNGLPLGKFLDAGKAALLDARRLLPGHYTLEAFPHTSDDVLLAPVKTELDIAPRYTLALAHDASPIHLGSPLDSDTVKLQVSVHSAAHIVKTRVYVSGELISEYVKPEFVIAIPIKPIPSGKTTFDVIGIAADGTHYAVESCPVEIKNEVWETEVNGTKEYTDLQAKLGEIAANKAQMQMWYEKFTQTPLSTKVGERWHDETVPNYLLGISGRGYTWQRFFQDTYAPTGALKYKQNADKCLQNMAHGYLDAGKLYSKLKMRQEAKRAFQSVVSLVGETTTEGQQAKVLLHELAIPD